MHAVCIQDAYYIGVDSVFSYLLRSRCFAGTMQLNYYYLFRLWFTMPLLFAFFLFTRVANIKGSAAAKRRRDFFCMSA